jgi:hypothetical protein
MGSATSKINPVCAMSIAVLWIRIRMDQHFGKPDPDLHYSEKLDPDPHKGQI